MLTVCTAVSRYAHQNKLLKDKKGCPRSNTRFQKFDFGEVIGKTSEYK